MHFIRAELPTIMLIKLAAENKNVEIETLLSWVNMGRNSLQMWNGFSSQQLVFGKNPNLPNIMQAEFVHKVRVDFTQSVWRYSNKYSSMPDKYNFSTLKYLFSRSQPTLLPFSTKSATVITETVNNFHEDQSNESDNQENVPKETTSSTSDKEK
jgi:hypothetical protein